MPTYEYLCGSCAHEFEAFQSIKDNNLRKCPRCGKLKLERLISATAFQLKGSGWYKDLYSSSKSDSLQKAVDKSDKSDKSPKKSTEAA